MGENANQRVTKVEVIYLTSSIELVFYRISRLDKNDYRILQKLSYKVNLHIELVQRQTIDSAFQAKIAGKNIFYQDFMLHALMIKFSFQKFRSIFARKMKKQLMKFIINHRK